MLTVTDDAGTYLHQALKEAGAGPKHALRLVSDSNGLGFAIDEPRENDLTYAHQGQVLLVVASELDQTMGDRSLVLETDDGEPVLALK